MIFFLRNLLASAKGRPPYRRHNPLAGIFRQRALPPGFSRDEFDSVFVIHEPDI